MCHLRAFLGAIITFSLPLAPILARAQFSPNCERNGRRDYCAITLGGAASTAAQAVDRVTFSDHTVYALVRNEASCKAKSPNVRTCNAKIIIPPGSEREIPAFYRGTAYEGGYKHEYIGGGIHITFSFLD